MRIIINTLCKCWILWQSHRESPDPLGFDEEPLNKHRRLTLDRWTGVVQPSTMERGARRDTRKPLKNEILLTKDVGILCRERVSVNDKGIMVGTTGIAALKAEYGDDFNNIEIIQDVGYSSESSTHLSSDDGFSVGGDRYIRVYNYPKQQDDPKAHLTKVPERTPVQSLASSLGSSSSGADSGLGGVSEGSAQTQDSAPPIIEEEPDFLETVLNDFVDFGASDAEQGVEVNGISDDLQGTFSGIESDESTNNIHNRSSFTSSQLYYKIMPVDSENDEEPLPKEADSSVSHQEKVNSSEKFSLSSFHVPSKTHQSSEIEEMTCKESNPLEMESDGDFQYDSFLSGAVQNSTPLRAASRGQVFSSPNLKRKRNSEPTVSSPRWQRDDCPQRIRFWLKRCLNDFENTSSIPRNIRRSLLKRGERGYSSSEDSVPGVVPSDPTHDLSSCDASGEYTSSSSDEGNPLSSSSSFLDDTLKERQDSFSGEGSVETVIRGCHEQHNVPFLLPPPLPSMSLKKKKSSLRCRAPSLNTSFRDLRWLVLKSLSDGDLRPRIAGSESEHSSSNSCSVQRKKKGNLVEDSLFDSCYRLSSSLPNILCHRSSEDVRDRLNTTSYRRSWGPSGSSLTTHNLSGCSDPDRKKKTRSRRKSAGSNRSCRSCEKSRRRSRNSTDQTILRRKLDFCEVSENSPPSDEEEGLLRPVFNSLSKGSPEKLNLKEELELALAGTHQPGSCLLSPGESDVVLTQLEEQSTVSDQVWDGYQEMQYLSEAYSEATMDEDAVRKLTEFGDDYGSAIGQLMLSDATEGCRKKMDGPLSPTKKSAKCHLAPVSGTESDSDLEDLHHVIEEAAKALLFARSTLKRRQDGDFFSSSQNAELLATCSTHLHWLRTICDHIECEEQDKDFFSKDVKELHDLIEEWRNLKSSIEMYEASIHDTPEHDQFLNAQKAIDALFHKMSELSDVARVEVKEFKSWDELQKAISRLQTVLSRLHEMREQLLAVNLQVHRFVTAHGHDSGPALKEQVTELYQRWEDIYERSGVKLTEFEALSTSWKSCEEKFENLSEKVTAMEMAPSAEDCDTSNISRAEDVSLDCKALKLAMKGTAPIDSLLRRLPSLEQRIYAHTTRHRSKLQKDDHPDSSSVEDDPDDHFEDAIHQIESDSWEEGSSDPLTTKRGTKKKKKGASRFWRILRVAVPVQLTLILLFCLACYLEPNCCDRLNNFNLSWTPHLRYLRGPPPV